MTLNLAAVLCGLSVLPSTQPLLASEGPGEKGPKRSFEVTNTERVNFRPGGSIHLDNSYGYLTVEGWDEPEVQVTVTKLTDRFYEPAQKEDAGRRLDLIRVVTERRSETELSITTGLASRHGDWAPPLPSTKKGGVTVECQIHVPRDSRVVIHHRKGYVWVSDVTGDIEVTSHGGDMIVMLPDLGPYSIDARTRMGSVSSDITGKARNNQFLVGSHFAYDSQAPSRRIYLRMGIGSITIKKGPATGPFGNE